MDIYMSVIILLYTGLQLFLTYFVRVGRTASSQISRLGVHHLFFGLGIALALLSAALCITPRTAEQGRQTI